MKGPQVDRAIRQADGKHHRVHRRAVPSEALRSARPAAGARGARVGFELVQEKPAALVHHVGSLVYADVPVAATGSKAQAEVLWRKLEVVQRVLRLDQLGLQLPPAVALLGELLSVAQILPHAHLAIKRATRKHLAKFRVRPHEPPDRAEVCLPLGRLAPVFVVHADHLVRRARRDALAVVVVAYIVYLHRTGRCGLLSDDALPLGDTR
mmetsp:Transcript_5693/g.13189  ORF Transcript_5693/g.13189 Transcript_5693/m.13189 type:complete len:209 (-) Transcript_5693:208-834(-)|eukprot:CAMPEP_0119353332 /NCGR_PEP_ID=MMETSP1334-20130426/2506_1 /TAXON_ID=127549 /ORGANISM="Calcidiscus leptoporus, Strain RCC1130" /LENGTH=208 /DNA_ID=CAMNT_0007366591 /DNA_START=618 /DNA_END=1244 /DNA_ORIENTATION=+